MNRKTIYLGLSILGAVVPYAVLIPWILENGPDVRLLFQEITATRMALYGWLDAVGGGVALIAWIVLEQPHRKVRLAWLPVLLTVAVAVSCGLPLYLYLREISPNPAVQTE